MAHETAPTLPYNQIVPTAPLPMALRLMKPVTLMSKYYDYGNATHATHIAFVTTCCVCVRLILYASEILASVRSTPSLEEQRSATSPKNLPYLLHLPPFLQSLSDFGFVVTNFAVSVCDALAFLQAGPRLPEKP